MLILWNILQYWWSCVCLFTIVVSLFFVLLQKNPVYAVFSFVLTALSASLFIFFLGAEFFALLILIIYTGVITVLFLFIVIMYNLRTLHSAARVNLQYVFFFFLPLMAFVFKFYLLIKGLLGSIIIQSLPITTEDLYILDVTHFIALFNSHYLVILICGLLIFIALIGSVVITYPFYKHQQ